MATNQQILDTLRSEFGVSDDVIRRINVTGAQSTVFRAKIIGALGSQGAALFDQAKAVINWKPDPNEAVVDNLWEALRARGATVEQYNQVLRRAEEHARTTPGYRPAGSNFAEQDFYAAVQEVLGPASPIVQSAFRQINVVPPNEPLAPTGPPAPSRAAPGATGNILAGATKMPAGAAGTTPQSPSGAPGAAGGAAGGGGVPTIASPTQPAGPPALRAGASDTEVEQWFQKYYGHEAWMYDVPELRQVMRDIASNPSGWTVDAVAGAMQNTGWWRETQKSVRDWTQTKAQDPATAAQTVTNRLQELKDAANAEGITVSDDRLRTMAEDSIKFGWTARQIQQAVGAEFHYTPGQQGGLVDSVRKLAKDYLVPMSDDMMQTWGTQLATGNYTEDQFKVYLREQAKSLFPTLTSALDSGVTTRQYLDPYAAIAADTLGINAADVDFKDAKWTRPLYQIDPKTNQRTVMNLADWRTELKRNPAYGWDKTEGARTEALQVVGQLGQMFGRGV